LKVLLGNGSSSSLIEVENNNNGEYYEKCKKL
jgi:hypothetical protein